MQLEFLFTPVYSYCPQVQTTEFNSEVEEKSQLVSELSNKLTKLRESKAQALATLEDERDAIKIDNERLRDTVMTLQMSRASDRYAGAHRSTLSSVQEYPVIN